MEPMNFNEAQWAFICINEKNYIFSDFRINPDSIPESLHMYHIRENDDSNDFATIEKHVFVNFGGTIITNLPIKFENNNEYLEIEEWGFIDIDQLKGPDQWIKRYFNQTEMD